MRLVTSFLSLLVCSVAASAATESFVLTDAAGKTSGPFAFENGVQVVLEGRAYTLTRVAPKEDPILQRLKELVVDDLQFKGARMEDLLPVLVTIAREKNRQSGSPEINMVYVAAPADAAKKKAPDLFAGDDFGFGGFPDESHRGPTFDLSFKKISMYETLRVACESTGATFAIENRVVVVRQGTPAAAKPEPKDAEAPAGK